MTRNVALLIWMGSALTFSSCTYEEVETPFSFQPPSSFPPVAYSNADNPITENGIALGRELFYDEILSLDSSISCASCHVQSSAFSDPGLSFSYGVDGKIGKRNSPALFNLAWSPNYMWDGGINHLDVMPLAPITDSLEMHLPMAEAIARLQASAKYKQLFKNAFQSDSITSQSVFYALSQFMVTMVSSESKYDLQLNQFSEDEQRGYQLFTTHCASCHQEPLFTDFSFANNGIDSVYTDLGRGRITLNSDDNGKFKVPSLRNVELTYPYMHDGRFTTLAEVINHYSEGVKTASVDSRISGPLHLTQSEKDYMLAFILTLTDWSYVSDSKFAKP